MTLLDNLITDHGPVDRSAPLRRQPHPQRREAGALLHVDGLVGLAAPARYGYMFYIDSRNGQLSLPARPQGTRPRGTPAPRPAALAHVA